MAKNLSHFYTFRSLGCCGRFECVKWEETGEGPVDIYKIDLRIQKCSCPAVARDCKHIRCAEQLTADGMVDEAFRFRWDEENEWLMLHDIVPIEELICQSESR